VRTAKPLAGQPVPGTFTGHAPFLVTEEGRRHPATRLVPWPGWSRRIWDSMRSIPTPWGTPFAYPVDEIAPGAEVLLRAEPEHGEPWPVAVAGPAAGGRVLWFGAADLGDGKAYGRPLVVADWQVLVRNWIAWLGGRVP
jgi:hypothetical protein